MHESAIGHPQPGTRPKGERGSKPKGSRTLGEHAAKASGSGFVSKVTSSTGSGCKPRARQPGGQLHQRATAGAVLRSSVSVVVLANRKRLQKSTGGARPLSPTREERVDNEGRSSLGARERSWGERAPEAGSSAAKRRVRWRALHLSVMAGAKALTREHLSMEGVSGRTKSFVLTSGRWKRSWSSS